MFRAFASRIAVASLTSASLLLMSCGGSLSGSSSTTATATAPTPTAAPASSPVNTPALVTIAAGQSVNGVDVNVSSPADSPSPNAQMLGVAGIGQSGASASNTGDVVQRGSNMKVIMFGPGLSGLMSVTISGPADIAVSNIRSITSMSNVPGIAFDVNVASNAALGARTVRLMGPNHDITTFTGGLEVRP